MAAATYLSQQSNARGQVPFSGDPSPQSQAAEDYPVRLIAKEDPAYPARMARLSSMPDHLYVRGSLPSDDQPTVGIVGARLCSAYGHRTALLFARALAKRGVQIVSGLALGIDGYAAEGTLDAGGRAFAVLGCGVDICYPRSNRNLYDQHLRKGGILSELPCGTEPLPYHFPQRNRIISALSDIVLVVEARQKSGSLITVDFALSQGKSVYAVPGRVGDRLSDGCNALIAQGAQIAWSPDAILKELKMQKDVRSAADRRKRAAEEARQKEELRRRTAQLSTDAVLLLAKLEAEEAQSAEVLADCTALPVGHVLAGLHELTRMGFAEEAPRGRYRLLLPS